MMNITLATFIGPRVPYSAIPLVSALFLAFLFLAILLFIFIRYRAAKKETERFLERVNYVENQNFTVPGQRNKSDGPITTWNNIWFNLFKNAKLIDIDKTSPEKIGIGMFLVPFSILFILSMVMNLGLAIFPVVAIYMIAYVRLSSLSKKHRERIDNQIPAFLSNLKSNIQADLTPENALIQAINSTDSPLYEELENTKAIAKTADFSVALNNLRRKTTSNDIKFLCSCIELAAENGNNLETQIIRIEEVVSNRRKVNEVLEKAIAENKPLLYVSSAVTPTVFYLTYTMNDFSKGYWFRAPISWVVFFGIIGLFALSIFLIKIFIGQVEKFKN